ncbi:MAG: hypothetical protein F4X56_10685 [Gammaproteobacteria bacterium]|nr:hypothetical protein [Gammaproteobacteria bacterium]
MGVRGEDMKLEIGPNGELRPVDPAQNAKKVVDIATGQVKEDLSRKKKSLLSKLLQGSESTGS